MNIDLIPIGDDPPNTINVVIEVPVGGEPVKYEFDKKSGALFVDRILHTAMRYPANYGFVPHTLSFDGDPIDALVVARSRSSRAAWSAHGRSRSCSSRTSMAAMRSCSRYRSIRPFLIMPMSGSAEDLPEIVRQQVEHFFTHYKDLEPEKWVRVGHWGDAAEAKRVLMEAIERAKAPAQRDG